MCQQTLGFVGCPVPDSALRFAGMRVSCGVPELMSTAASSWTSVPASAAVRPLTEPSAAGSKKSLKGDPPHAATHTAVTQPYRVAADMLNLVILTTNARTVSLVSIEPKFRRSMFTIDRRGREARARFLYEFIDGCDSIAQVRAFRSMKKLSAGHT